MISFENDYSEICNKEIIEAIEKYQNEQNVGYGLDKHSLNAAKLIKKACGHNDLDVHFIQGGTPCNVLAMELLKPYEAIISVESGHINVHETGAIEHHGYKIIQAKGKEGKLIPESIDDIMAAHTDEHSVKPKLVFIANATEYGTTYTKQELKAIRNKCNKYNLYLYIDGARIGNALLASNLTLKDIADIADLFYIGGTKNGALLGEAFCIKNKLLKKDFRYIIKQNCSLLAKGFICGIMFETLFKNDLYFKNAKQANLMADKLRDEFTKKGIKFLYKTKTNQIFVILTNYQFNSLKKNFLFSKWSKYDQNHVIARFVTSWATKEENVDALIKKLSSL